MLPQLHFHQPCAAGGAVGTGQIQRGRVEQIPALGNICQNHAFQQDNILAQQDFVNGHGGIFRAYGLTFVAQKQDAASGKYGAGFLSDSGITGDENAPDSGGPGENGLGIRGRDGTMVPSQEAISYKMLQIHLLHGFSVTEKMEGNINMGAVMGAHGESSQVVQIPGGSGGKGLLLRFGIAGVDGAGENLLGNIVNLLSLSRVQNGFDEM